jgi:hypothetical protein
MCHKFLDDFTVGSIRPDIAVVHHYQPSICRKFQPLQVSFRFLRKFKQVTQMSFSFVIFIGFELFKEGLEEASHSFRELLQADSFDNGSKGRNKL